MMHRLHLLRTQPLQNNQFLDLTIRERIPLLQTQATQHTSAPKHTQLFSKQLSVEEDALRLLWRRLQVVVVVVVEIHRPAVSPKTNVHSLPGVSARTALLTSVNQTSTF
jgi:hypothetical protein